MSAVLAPEAETSPGLLRKVGSLLLLPSVIVLLAWMIVPLAMTLWFSIQYYNLVDPTTTGFAGLDNYRYLVTDPDFWVSLRNTLVLVASVLVVTVGLGTLLAVLFNEPFPGRNVARVLAISPFFVMPTVSALVWKNLMMHPIYGVFGAVARGARDAVGRLVRRLPARLGHRNRIVGMAALRAADPADRRAIARSRAAGSRPHGRRRRRWHSSFSSRCRICRARSAWW